MVGENGQAGGPLCVNMQLHVEADSVAYNHARDIYCLVNLTAPKFDTVQRAPLRVVYVLDNSGSMEGDKLELLKQSVTFGIGQLRPCDHLGVVVFNNTVDVLLPITPMTKENRARACAALARVCAGGGTNLSGGLLKGLQILQESAKQDEIAAVLLFTDGQANVGIQTSSEMIRAFQGARMMPQIMLHAFGYGADHDSQLLSALSDAASGMYYFMRNQDNLGDAFSDCLGGLLTVAAQNIELLVETAGPPGNKILKVCGQHGKASMEDEGRRVRLQLDDLVSERSRAVLLLLSVPEIMAPGTTRVTAHLGYFNVPIATQLTATTMATIRRVPADQVGPSCFVAEIEAERTRLDVAEALAEADRQAALGNMEQAKTRLQHAMHTLDSSHTGSRAQGAELKTQLQRGMLSVQSRDDYRSFGAHNLRSTTQNISRQAQSHYVTHTDTTLPAHTQPMPPGQFSLPGPLRWRGFFGVGQQQHQQSAQQPDDRAQSQASHQSPGA